MGRNQSIDHHSRNTQTCTHKPQIDNQWATLKQSMSKQIKPAHVQREKKRREEKKGTRGTHPA